MLENKNLLKKDSYLKEKDLIMLNKVLQEIKKLPKVHCIMQIGSSTYSKNYKDVDIIVFFDKVLSPPKISELNKKYSKHNFYIEGNSINAQQIDRGIKIFIKFLSHLKTKKILYGKYPYKNIKVSVNKIDVTYYIRYHYNFALFQQVYENILSTSLNALLTYKNIFPENKQETLYLFKKTFPDLFKFLPKNAEYYLRNTNELNFGDLYKFFEESIKSLLDKK